MYVLKYNVLKLPLDYLQVKAITKTKIKRKRKKYNAHTKKVKGLAKELCMTHGHGQQCGDCLRELGGAGWRGVKGKNWDNYNSINNKILNKNKIK